jgi:hypothetical protein
MSKLTYREQLLHPKWQKRRLEILNRAGFACEDCEDDQTTLHVHHKIYRKGAKAWEYATRPVALCGPAESELCAPASEVARLGRAASRFLASGAER